MVGSSGASRIAPTVGQLPVLPFTLILPNIGRTILLNVKTVIVFVMFLGRFILINKKQGRPGRKASRKFYVNLRAVLGPARSNKKIRIRRVEQTFLTR